MQEKASALGQRTTMTLLALLALGLLGGLSLAWGILRADQPLQPGDGFGDL